MGIHRCRIRLSVTWRHAVWWYEKWKGQNATMMALANHDANEAARHEIWIGMCYDFAQASRYWPLMMRAVRMERMK